MYVLKLRKGLALIPLEQNDDSSLSMANPKSLNLRLAQDVAWLGPHFVSLCARVHRVANVFELQWSAEDEDWAEKWLPNTWLLAICPPDWPCNLGDSDWSWENSRPSRGEQHSCVEILGIRENIYFSLCSATKLTQGLNPTPFWSVKSSSVFSFRWMNNLKRSDQWYIFRTSWKCLTAKFKLHRHPSLQLCHSSIDFKILFQNSP